MLRTVALKLLLVIVGVLVGHAYCNLADELGDCLPSLPRTQFVKSYNDVCLYLITGKRSWNNANSNCHRNGGRLVQIQDQDKQDFVYNTLKSMHWEDRGVWIGATDHDSEGTWKWTDGTKLSYGHWHPGEGPTHGFLFSKAGYEDCALMRIDDSGRWHDYDCGTILYHHTSICEYKKVFRPTVYSPTSTTTMSTTLPTTKLIPPVTPMPTTATTTMSKTTVVPTTYIPTTKTDMPTTSTTMSTTTMTTMPTTTTTMPTTTTTMPTTTTTTMPTTTTTTMPTTTTTTMPTTTTTMPTTTTTTMPTTTTTTLPTTTTTTMPTTTTTQMKTTAKPAVTTTFGGIKIEFGATPIAKKRKAELDSIDAALLSRHDDTNDSSTGPYIAIGASSCGVVVLVVAIIALILRRRKSQSVAETYNPTANSREKIQYTISCMEMEPSQKIATHK
ncbi:hepatitis A virus cellular receptor 1-like [Pecten maximus]|uniref:hepatitis A virus cellular receptor 1-like n=1 Tax=Pecten maximus TaxID=6579 RepID=UPI0014583038|nr:hepatitis A virus cellular receptor 1-like [Pecten maximus]